MSSTPILRTAPIHCSNQASASSSLQPVMVPCSTVYKKGSKPHQRGGVIWEKALSTPTQRLELLQQLFADIALEIDDRAKDIIIDNGEDEIAKANNTFERCLCFYDVLANHFVTKPENGKHILELIVLLWSQSSASHIFALLFHKWLFEVPVENQEAFLRYGSALVQGASDVFWIDIQTNKRRFISLFRYLLEDVVIVPPILGKLPLQARRDLFHLLSKFLFFYNFDYMLEVFLKHCPISTNTFLISSPADVFVIELTDQLQKLKVEPVLLHYLASLRALKGVELRMTTSTKLRACLYSFISPGGPMYPTRAVRHAAWDSLDLLFPVGQYPRHVISLFFRLLYPWYWPSSCWNFVKVCITTVLYSLLRLLFSSWERMKKSRRD